MDDEIETLVVAVRADTRPFARDVAAMRGELEGSFASGADRAGRAVEGALMRAVRGGKIGFEDLQRTALAVLADIARSALSAGLGSLGGGRRGGGLGGVLAGLIGSLAGRATGGPVSPHVPYLVGERGPELFVPTAAGRIETGPRGGRDLRVNITIRPPAGGDAPAALARSGRQVARAVKAALAGAD